MFGLAEKALLESCVKSKITGKDKEQKCIDRFENILADLSASGKIKKLARSMPKRIAECLENDGGATDY